MTIDGKNIKEYGCTLLEGSYDTLLKYPKRTSVKSNNWADVDGIEPDLSVVEFEAKTVKLSFLMEANTLEGFWSQYRKLIADMSAPGYREMNLIPGMTNRMRFSAGASYNLPVPFNEGKNLSSFDLNFIEDNHAIIPAPYPSGGITLRGQYEINGIDFGAFGIGSDDEQEDILKYPAMKSPFTDGRSVDFTTLTMQHKEIKLSLWMLAGSVDEFLNNYRAFFFQLTDAGTQDLYISTLGGSVSVYYSDCSSYSVEIWQENQIGVRFTISLVAPVVSWVDAGGTTKTCLLFDNDLGFITDEDGNVLELD